MRARQELKQQKLRPPKMKTLKTITGSSLRDRVRGERIRETYEMQDQEEDTGDIALKVLFQLFSTYYQLKKLKLESLFWCQTDVKLGGLPDIFAQFLIVRFRGLPTRDTLPKKFSCHSLQLP
jgi:hypothetical protein